MTAFEALIGEFGATSVSFALDALGYEAMPFDDEDALLAMAEAVRHYLTEGA